MTVGSGVRESWIAQLGSPSLFTPVPAVDALGTLASTHLSPPPALSRPVPDLDGGGSPLPLPPAAEAALQGKFRALAACARIEIERLALSPASGTDMQGGGGLVVALLQWWDVRLAALARLRVPHSIVREDHNLWSVLERTTLPSAPDLTRVGSPQAQTQASTTAPPSPPPPPPPKSKTRTLSASPLVPFSLRVLHARAPRLAGDLLLAVRRVSELRTMCHTHVAQALRVVSVEAREMGEAGQARDGLALPQAMAKVWLDRARRLSLVLVGLLLESRDPRGALTALEEVFLPHAVPQGLLPRDDPWLLCLAARMQVVLGLVSRAEETCARAEQLYEARRAERAGGSGELARLELRIQSTRSLILVARGEAARAEDVLRTTLAQQPTSTTTVQDGPAAASLPPPFGASEGADLPAGDHPVSHLAGSGGVVAVEDPTAEAGSAHSRAGERQLTSTRAAAQAEERILRANASTTLFLQGQLVPAAQEAWALLCDTTGGDGARGNNASGEERDLSPQARATAGATALVFNSATYCELAADNALEAKRGLLRQVAAQATDGARVSALKMT